MPAQSGMADAPPTDTLPQSQIVMYPAEPAIAAARQFVRPPLMSAPPVSVNPLMRSLLSLGGERVQRAYSAPAGESLSSDSDSDESFSQDTVLAMEAASDMLMYRTELSDWRRGTTEPPMMSTATMASLGLMSVEEQEAVPRAQVREKPTLTPLRLLMAVLLNLVDCINMNILTPYAAEMVADLLNRDVNDPEVLRNVGLLIGVYNISEMIFSPIWGRLSDRYGRRPVILTSVGGAMLVPIAFGLSQSMGMALAVRAVNGVLCGSIGITKTYVAELVDKKNEARAFSILTTVYSVGMILGPAMGGMLVSPAKWSPAADRFFSQGVWRIFKDRPFLLPNVVFSLLAMIVWLLAVLFFSESLHKEEREALRQARAEIRALKLQAQKEAALAKAGDGADKGSWAVRMCDCLKQQFPFLTYPTRLLRAIGAYGLAVGYVISTVQNIILLYQVPVEDGGFGLGPERLGMLQNFAAVGLLTTQLCLYPKLVQKRGYRWCVVVGLCGVLLVTLPMPLYGLMHDPAQFAGVRMVPVIVMMVVQQASFGFCTPTTTVWINRFADGLDRGEVNGWANSFAALCRALAPMGVGFLQGLGNSMSWEGGQYLALYVISFLAVAVGGLLLPVLPKFKRVQAVVIKEEEEEEEEETTTSGDSDSSSEDGEENRDAAEGSRRSGQ